MKAISLATFAFVLFCFSGCATIANGRHQSLIINSDPPGAAFEVDGVTGVTPGTANVERGRSDHTVRIHKPGYQPSELKVGRKVNPWLAGNLLLYYGFLPGLVVDLLTGGGYQLANSQVQSTLQPDYGVPTEFAPPQVSSKLPVNKIVATSATNSVPVDDQQMANRIANALGQAGLNSIPLEVHYADGKARITGVVANPEQRATITQVVSDTAGVKSIDNRVTVSKAGTASTGKQLAARGQEDR